MNHEVFNQVPAYEDVNLFQQDTFLKELMEQSSADWASVQVSDYGKLVGSHSWTEKGHQANRNSPVFHSHDRFGNRIDAIEFHPAYHDIMNAGISHSLHALPWTNPKPGAHFARLAMNYMHAQNEAGTNCPITMTFSCVPALKKHFPHAEEWLQKITAPVYDPANKPYFEKDGLTIGMAMTEKQGGTDVRANTTTAKAVGEKGKGALYLLNGHKWFCSAPMCDAFLTLAQTEEGLSCFLMPRWTAEGKKNTWQIQRLKEKLGNQSNASSEIEMYDAHAWMVGEPGRGVPTIIEMVAMTRYDCMIGSAGLMRRAVAEAVHHAQHRSVMGKVLIQQPLMQSVLCDLITESEAALAMAHLASQCIEIGSKDQQALLRLLLPIGKYWITKRASPLIVEAMECLGGNGYVETSVLPRLYREAPVNAIWEGSGNVQCLDVHRAIQKSPEAMEVLLQFLENQKGKLPTYDAHLEHIKKQLSHWLQQPALARVMVEQLAVGIQAAQLLVVGNKAVAENFCSNRLHGKTGMLFGAQQAVQPKEILKRWTL